MAIKSVFTKKQRKEHYKGAIEVATKFLEAIRYEKDWRPFAQKHYSQWDLGSRPFIIKFEDFEMQRTGAVSGANVDICTGVYFKLTIPELVGSLPKRSMIARLAVWCETGPMQPSIDGEWGVAPNSMRVTEGRDNDEI